MCPVQYCGFNYDNDVPRSILTEKKIVESTKLVVMGGQLHMSKKLYVIGVIILQVKNKTSAK